jgi:protein-arginine kinase activator protein McsA
MTISLPYSITIRKKKELNQLLDAAIILENYELCAQIRDILKNYDKIIHAFN